MPDHYHQKALFLDRDGIINEDHGYVYRFEDFTFIEGIFDLIHRFVAQGYLPVVVTNQSGIGRGMYTESDFHSLMGQVQGVFTQQGLPTVPVYFCPNHPTKGIGRYKVSCNNRKPAPGMLLTAQQEWNIDFARSVMVGDSWRDIVAAQRAGVGLSYFLKGKPIPNDANLENVKVVESLNDILSTF